MTRHRLACLLTSLAILVLAAPADALKLEFPNPSFSPSGRASKGRLYVTNDGTTMAGFEVRVQTRSHDPDGQETNEPTEDFVVFPKQILLEAGAERMVSITWKGPRKVDSERAYRLIIEQLPIAFDAAFEDEAGAETKSQINVLSIIKKAIYVTPEPASPHVVAESAEIAAGEPLQLQLLLHNRGSAHQIVNELRLKLTPLDAGGLPRADPVDVRVEAADFGGHFNVLAGERHRVALAWPDGLPEGAVGVKLE